MVLVIIVMVLVITMMDLVMTDGFGDDSHGFGGVVDGGPLANFFTSSAAPRCDATRGASYEGMT
jgi:hypothetical protein